VSDDVTDSGDFRVHFGDAGGVLLSAYSDGSGLIRVAQADGTTSVDLTSDIGGARINIRMMASQAQAPLTVVDSAYAAILTLWPNGDILIGAGAGPVVKSPNGNAHRITVANDGTVSSEDAGISY
jgi:hypothetical protein